MEERVGVDLDEVLDVASVGWWSWEPARDRVRLSTRALSLFGLREDPQDGLPLMLQRVHADERRHVEATMRDAARKGAAFELEFRVLRADGERWVRCRAGPSKLHAGTYVGIIEDVHGRRTAEEEVRRLAAIVASSGDAIIAKDLDGTVRSWNPAAQRIFGYTQEEAVGSNIRVLIPEDRWGEEARLMDLIRAGQRIDHYESVRVCKDGKPIQVSLTLSPVFDEAGRISGVSTIARDITHVARQRARLARSEELLHQAQHLARMGSWEWRPPEPRVHWSRELYSVYGLEPDGFVPTFDACIALIHPDDQARVRRHLEQAAASHGATIDLHYRIRRPDGQVRWLHGRGQVERTDGRTVVRGTCQDVTESHRAQVQFKALFEGSPDGMVLLDASGNILLTNPQLNWQFGHSSSELVGQPLAMLVPALATRDVAHLLGVASPGNLGESLDLHGVRKDGSRFPVELNLRDLELEDGRGFVVTVRDVSERLRLERLKQEAERLREMADFRAQFINSAAHELKTPLTPVRIQVAILREATRPLGMRAQKALDVLERNFDRLERIVQDVIEAAKLQAHALHVRLAPVDLGHATCRAADAFRPLAQSSGLRLECRAEDRLVAHADQVRLEQVLDNLLSNAVKFTPAGGRITVTCRRQGEWAALEVCDTGIGLDQAALRKLFQPFTQVHGEEASGRFSTGLGLYISKGLVEAHGGRLEVHSDGPGQGCRFTVLLPLEPPPGRAMNRPRRVQRSDRGEPVRHAADGQARTPAAEEGQENAVEERSPRQGEPERR